MPTSRCALRSVLVACLLALLGTGGAAHAEQVSLRGRVVSLREGRA